MVDIYASVAGSSQTIASGSVVKLDNLSLTEVVPTGAPSPWHNGNSRWEIATGWDGIYFLNASGQWSATFTQSCLIQARVNGSELVNLYQGPGSPDTSGAVIGGCRHIRLEAGDYVDLRVRQMSGSSKSFTLDEGTLQWVRG